MSFLEDLDGVLDLNEQLFIIPPRITIISWINNFLSFVNNVSMLIMKYKVTCKWIDEFWDMDKVTTILLL